MSDLDIADRTRALAETFDRSFQVPARVHEEDGRAALAIQAGGDAYVLVLEGLSSVARAPRIVPLPARLASARSPVPGVQLGLAGIRGGLVGVFSLPALLGYEVAVARMSWLAVTGGPRPVALAFEALDGQVVIPAKSIAGSAAEPGARRHVAGLVLLAGETSTRGLLDLESLLSRLAGAGDV